MNFWGLLVIVVIVMCLCIGIGWYLIKVVELIGG